MLSVLHIKRGVYRGSDYSLQLQKSPFYRLQNMKIGLSSIQSTFGFYGLITYAIDSHLRVITVTSLLHIQNTIIILIIITIYCKEAPIYFSNIFFSLLGLAYFPPLECSLRFTFFWQFSSSPKQWWPDRRKISKA